MTGWSTLSRSVADPTAQMSPAPRATIEASPLCATNVLGTDTWFGATLHVVPSKCMISAVFVPSGLTRPSPTAQMSVGDTAATAFRPARTVGVVATVHDLPSQCSTSAVTPGDLPTAHTLVEVSAT